MKNILRNSLLALGLVASISGDSYSKLNYKNALNVKQAQLEYSLGSIKSEGFWNCTAVIMDYGNEVIFAHAWPSTFDAGRFLDSMEEQYSRKGYPLITIDDIVEEINKEAKRRNLRNGEAVLVGYSDNTNEVARKLKDNGINIRKIVTREAIGKQEGAINVFYNPVIDSLDIENN